MTSKRPILLSSVNMTTHALGQHNACEQLEGSGEGS